MPFRYTIGTLAVIVILVASFFAWNFFGKQNGVVKGVSSSADKPPLMLKTLGIKLGAYNSKNGRAGDFRFTDAKVSQGLILMPFGYVIPGNSATKFKAKTSPQVEFRVPMGTKVLSLVDGVVVNVPKLYSGDYSIMVATSRDSNWIYETEHVIKPLVKVGDRVKSGQVIAQVSPHNKENYDGLGLVEIGILHGGREPMHVCPFAYLDPSIKDETFKNMRLFFRAWEKQRGNTALYKENAMQVPGCMTLNPLPG